MRLVPHRLVALALLSAIGGGCSSDCTSEGDGPNVVVVVVDTLRADRLPFYGYEKDTAPFLTSLAQRGVVFERAWSTSSWTAPSTASLFTSLYPFQHGVEQGIKLVRDVKKEKDPTLRVNRIPGRLETLPELARSLGYRTFGITDNPNICREEGFEDGFCSFQNFDYAHADAVNAKLAEWRDEIASEGKWFVYLHYMDPHFPYAQRAPWFVAPPGAQPGRKAPREVQRPWVDAAYDSEIRYADEHIRGAFEMLGVDEDTVIVFAADHGEELLQRSDVLQHDFKLYSELTHIPLFVVHPGAKLARNRVTQNVSLVDVMPTLRDILGGSPSRQDAGESLVPYYTASEEREPGRPVFSMRRRLEVLGGGELVAVIRDEDKLIAGRHPEKKDLEFDLLFDLGEDWEELRDLAPTQKERVRELLDLWVEFASSADVYDPETGRKRLDEEQRAKIEELGYVEDVPTGDS